MKGDRGMKYKVGDRVKVRSDLKVGRDYTIYVNGHMAGKAGQVVKITECHNNHYHILADAFDWSDDMFEGLAEDKPAPIKAYDLMKLAAENPEKYEGKRYKVVRGACIGPSRETFWEVVVDVYGRVNGKGYENWAYFNDICTLEEIPPEPKPVSFMEAVKAYSEGKTIRCEVNESTMVYEPVDWSPKHCAMKSNKSKLGPNAVEILEGKWLIEP